MLNLVLTTLCASTIGFFVSASVKVFAIANLLIALTYVFMMVRTMDTHCKDECHLFRVQCRLCPYMYSYICGGMSIHVHVLPCIQHVHVYPYMYIIIHVYPDMYIYIIHTCTPISILLHVHALKVSCVKLAAPVFYSTSNDKKIPLQVIWYDLDRRCLVVC